MDSSQADQIPLFCCTSNQKPGRQISILFLLENPEENHLQQNIYCKVATRWDRNFFMETAVKHWNRLPRKVGESPPLEGLRKGLDMAPSDQSGAALHDLLQPKCFCDCVNGMEHGIKNTFWFSMLSVLGSVTWTEVIAECPVVELELWGCLGNVIPWGITDC